LNILIAGATGFLGMKLTERLCDFISPTDTINLFLLVRNKIKLTEEILYNKNITICDINSNTLQEKIIDFAPDIIFSTSCCYETEIESLLKTIDANYVFPARLLQIAVILQKHVRFISIGTGLPSFTNSYSLAKRQFAELGFLLHKNSNVDFLNLELESFYGINEPKDRFISKSILLLKSNQDLLLTEGTQKRDFIFIDDLVEILVFLIDCNLTVLSNKEYNIPIGTGINPSIKEIILFLYNEINSKSNLKFGAVKNRDNEPNTCADLSILRKLGFSRPLIHWKDGMKKVIGSIA